MGHIQQQQQLDTPDTPPTPTLHPPATFRTGGQYALSILVHHNFAPNSPPATPTEPAGEDGQ